MEECKNLIKIDITPWHGDVFDHPTYEYRCKETNTVIHPMKCRNCKIKKEKKI